MVVTRLMVDHGCDWMGREACTTGPPWRLGAKQEAFHAVGGISHVPLQQTSASNRYRPTSWLWPEDLSDPHSPPGLESQGNPAWCLVPSVDRLFSFCSLPQRIIALKTERPCLTLRWCELERRERHIRLTASARRPAKECGLDGRLSTVCRAGERWPL